MGRSSLGVLAVAGALLSTLAAPAHGRTLDWSAGRLPSGIASLAAISCQPIAGSEHCVAVGGNGTGGTASIAVGGDGGRSWQSEQAPPGVSGLFGVSCISAEQCWAVGTSAEGTQGVVVDTRDGGSSWTTEYMPPGISEIDGISCSGATCLATGGSLAGQVLVTDDGGVTWALRRLPGLYAATGATAASATVTYAVGGNQCGGPHVNQCPGAIWRSSDSGATWQLVDQSLPYGDAISCSDASHCLAAAATKRTGAIESTSDGGRHWRSQRLPGFAGFFNAVSCRGSECVAVGQNPAGTAGVIASTHDGGQHWALQSSPPGTGALYGVATAGPSSAQAVGENPGRTAPAVIQAQPPLPQPSHSGPLGPATLAALLKVERLSGPLAQLLRTAIEVDCTALPTGCGNAVSAAQGHFFVPIAELEGALQALDQYSQQVSAIASSVKSLLAGPATRAARQRMRELADQLSFGVQAEFTRLALIDAIWQGAQRNEFNGGMTEWNHAALAAIEGMRALAIGRGSAWP